MINTPLNYTGSKFKLLPQILPLMDYNKEAFVDVFAGGGSVYTNIMDKYTTIIVNDIIKDLMLIQKTLIKENAQNFLNKVKRFCHPVSTVAVIEGKDAYNQLRENYNNLGDPARLMALMLTCTNNMLRFNKKFKFNQTYGKRNWNKNTDKKVEAYLRHVQYFKSVRNIIFGADHFSKVKPNEKCMIYLDPPYFNTEAGYNCFWSKGDEDELYDYVLNLDRNGASFMLSGVLKHNNNTSELLTKLINDGFKKINLELNYNKVSRKGLKETQEIVIINY